MSPPTALLPVVLVIDDEPVIHGVIRSFLEGQGYSVLGAASGAEAVRQACVCGGDLRLALIELSLRDWDSVALGRALRQIRPGLPCGYITWGIANPVGPLLHKPFACGELVQFVSNVVAAEATPGCIEWAASSGVKPFPGSLCRSTLA
jgi:CheY-like chemotaxis protein